VARLGGSGLLRIEGDSLRNEQGLIFSGADMTLRTTSLTNLLGDIYSLGELDVARDEQGGNLDLLENRSASIESAGDMTLRAAVLRNRKDVFDWRLAQTYGGISVVCYDCGGDHHNVDYVATERFEARVEADSASSRIHSGANLLLKGGEIVNRYSTLSSAGDIDIDAVSLENTGATLASVERVRRYNTGRVTDGTDERFRANYINPYNAQPLPKVLPGAMGQWNLVSDIQRETPIGVAAPGIIQAGGDVRIQATQPITNESVLAHNAPQDGAGQTLDTTVDAASQPLVVRLNPQLPADTAQQAVDPISLPGFSLPQGQNGLFQTNTNPGHRYLIETNPAFADLKQFVSSDYMLGLLGFDTDAAQKRLGDGLYEQRLLEQAVAARTGKRYLDGFTNNDAQFRYLMDNAIASKDALNLSVGIGLSSAQVAALTHDIVWLEEREVNGEKVLVPVLYLAQVGDRLAPGGALIQGQDVALISGGNLNNSGTLRASENLSVTAANIGNSGLMQANQRLQLLATDSIRNTQGGIINGQDVSLIAMTGDIRNERTISQQSLDGEGFSQLTSVVDTAAGIEASNDLQLFAGGDIENIGGSLKAGGDAQLNAGGDVIIASAAEEHGSMRKDKRHFWNTTSTTQHGSDVQVGGDLTVTAGQDIAVVASTVKAGGDVLLDAGRDVTIAAAVNESSSEYRYKRSGKKVNKEDSSVRQQAAVIEAGGDLGVLADGNLILSASQLKAEGEAFLYAGEQLALLAAQNSDYYLYDMKKKGSWGSKKTQRDEVTTVRNVGSSITTGGDLTLVSEGDQLYQKARLESGNDLILDSGGSITFEAVKDLDQESHEKSKSSWAWTSAKGKGKTDETLKQSELIAQGDLVIQAVDGLKIDIKQVNQQSVSQTIDAMVKADPELAWLKEAEARGDVDWRRVKEVHDSFKYSHSALGGPAAMIIAIIVTYLTWGAGSGLVGAAQGTWQAAAANTVVSSVASNAATSTINNRGNLGAVVKDVTSADAVRGYVVGGVTAGLTAGLFDGLLQTKTDPLTGKVTVDLSNLEGVGRFAGNQILQNGTSTILDRALGGDSSLSDVLRTSLANTFAAAGFNLIGDQTAPGKWDLKDGSVAKIGLHAVMGGLAAEAAGGDFKTGALAAGVNEALVDSLSSWYGEMDSEQKKSLLVMNSQVIGVLTAAAQGGDEKALQTGSWVAKNATQYNYTAHWDEFEKQHDACKKNPSGSGCSTVLKVAGVSSESLGSVVLNKDANGAIVSYTLLGDAGVPWMVMEPAEYKMYIASPQHIQEGYKTAPQWQLNLSSALLYAHHGDTERAVENYAFMLRDPGYQQEILLGLAMGGLGRLALGPKATAGSVKGQATPSFPNQFPDHPTGVPTLISDTKLTQGAGKYNYVVLEDGQLVIGRKFNDVGGGHIDLASGKPVIAAGEVKIVSGKVKYIDNTSGHYEPSGRAAQTAAENAFSQKGFDVAGKYIEKVWVPDPINPRTGAWVPK
jgi:adhesin HecA-like repeat protein